MNIQLVDFSEDRANLLPLTYMKSISDLRVGILTIREKWEKYLGKSPAVSSAAYLEKKYPASDESVSDYIVNAAILPDTTLIQRIADLAPSTVLEKDGVFLAARMSLSAYENDKAPKYNFEQDISLLTRTWDIFLKNRAQIEADFKLLTRGRKSQKLTDPHTIVYGNDLFLEEGAIVKAAIINTENGPVYLGRNTRVNEGAIIRGAFALCDHSELSMGAKVRGDATVGPYSKVGGEFSNSVVQGYSNKSHDGYLGNSVLGEWCNLGADTNNSNLKNNYGEVKMWDYQKKELAQTGLNFCGLIMGDHSKSAINTMFNTGTTAGISSNIFGSGFPRNFIPSFTWGGAQGLTTYRLEAAFETMQKMMERKGKSLSEVDKGILAHIFESTAQYRVWEK